MNYSKKFLSMIFVGVLGAALLTGCGNTDGSRKDDIIQIEDDTAKDDITKTDDKTDESTAQNTEVGTQGGTEDTENELLTGIHHVNINIKDMGTIAVELDADSAPITVTNFINLAESGFYDGLTFHRIIKDFMMQGGDPAGDGTGGAEENIKGEFEENGVPNSLSHTRGAISMARARDFDSASSQFFIVHQDSTYLDGSYAAFGYVTEGMDIVDDICENTKVQNQNGAVLMENRPIIESIEVVD